MACIYFAYRSNVVEREKRYRLLCMLLSERKVGDWLSIFCENGKKKETRWDKVERHKV